MSGNTELILAGIGPISLAWFAPTGSAAPTTATAAPAAAFKDAGYITEDGLSVKVNESSKDIKAYGSQAPVRTISTESKTTFDIEFLESNEVSLAIYHRKELGSFTVGATGTIDFSTGPASSERYAAIFDMVDGDNHLRAYCPQVEVTDRGDLAIKAGEAIGYPVVLTAYPDGTGANIYWFYLLNALAA